MQTASIVLRLFADIIRHSFRALPTPTPNRGRFAGIRLLSFRIKAEDSASAAN